MNRNEKEIMRIALRRYILECANSLCNEFEITDLQLITNRNMFENIRTAKKLIGELI